MTGHLVIADTGIIVGLINAKDQWHNWARDESKRLAPPFYTCEAVITEACQLLRGVHNGPQKVIGMVADRSLQIRFSVENEISVVGSAMKKYSDLPMSLADACLLRMSEQIENSAVFTVDSDFLIYRKNGRTKVPLISPFEN